MNRNLDGDRTMASQKKGPSAKKDPAAHQAREVELLNAITAETSQSSDLAGILNHSLQRALGLVEIERGGIYLLDERSGLLKIAVIVACLLTLSNKSTASNWEKVFPGRSRKRVNRW